MSVAVTIQKYICTVYVKKVTNICRQAVFVAC